MRHRAYLLLLLALLLGASACKKDEPEEQLPPATQTGAGTFGCLVNGQPWTPKGNNGRDNFRVTYDPGYAGGSLIIRVYRYPDQSSTFQSMVMGGDRISQVGSYPFVLVGDRQIFFTDTKRPNPCNYYGDVPPLTQRTGNLTITRLDLQAGIVSGTFAFTLAQPGCDTIRVTQGRFDKKL